MNDKEEKALWIEFAKATIQSYEIPESIDDLDDLVDDISELSATVADAMVDEYTKRYDRGGDQRRTRGRGRKRDREQEPEGRERD